MPGQCHRQSATPVCAGKQVETTVHDELTWQIIRVQSFFILPWGQIDSGPEQIWQSIRFTPVHVKQRMTRVDGGGRMVNERAVHEGSAAKWLSVRARLTVLARFDRLASLAHALLPLMLADPSSAARLTEVGRATVLAERALAGLVGRRHQIVGRRRAQK